MYARTPDRFVAVRAPITNTPQDVIVSATFHKIGGPPGGGYGLILRDQGVGAGDGVDQFGQFIVAEVGDRGDVGVWRRDGDRWLDMAPWTPSAAVRADTATNVLTIHLIGDRLVFFVNASQVADLKVDAGLSAGNVGVFTGGDLNQVNVDHFLVQQPARPAPPRQATDARPASSGPALPPPAARPELPPSEPLAPQFGSSKPGVSISNVERVRDLLVRIAVDIAAIFQSFSNGIDAPHSPVNDPAVLRNAKGRLDSATGTAVELATELQNIKDGEGAQGGR
jgi:hypothetical protein